MKKLALSCLCLLAACANQQPKTDLDDIAFAKAPSRDGTTDLRKLFFDDVVEINGVQYSRLGRSDLGYQELHRSDGAVCVLVPAGHFTKREYDFRPPLNEAGVARHLPAFLIDKHEVTNWQVCKFLLDQPKAVYRDNAVFAPDGKTPWAVSHQWGLQIDAQGPRVQSGYTDFPAVGVSGHLALAYAKWVGGDLPTDDEWEKAAGGPDGLLFPWGYEMPTAQRANSYLSGPRATMRVASHAEGASPYGCLNMAGNVYERAYWGNFEPADATPRNLPTMLKGGAWVSPNWWNLRCVCRCGQNMDAMDGSVGFRVVVRGPEVLRAVETPRPALRTLADTWNAYEEAASRNVPILLYLGYERCGQCDRVQAELFTDPKFVEYCNANLVVLIGHCVRREIPIRPHSPVDENGNFVPHTGLPLADMEQVFTDFAFWRKSDIVPIPPEGLPFRISPGFYLLNPHRKHVRRWEDAWLVHDDAFHGHKTGASREHFLGLFQQAQQKLGKAQTRADHEAGKPGPDMTWEEPPADQAMWNEAQQRVQAVAAALKRFKKDYGEYPQEFFWVLPYLPLHVQPYDPFGGKYLAYTRTEGGFKLTCLGADEEEGGEGIDADISLEG